MKIVQSIDYVAVGPPLVVAIGALALLVLDLLLPRPYRWLLGWIPIAVVLIGILSLVPLKAVSRSRRGSP